MILESCLLAVSTSVVVEKAFPKIRPARVYSSIKKTHGLIYLGFVVPDFILIITSLQSMFCFTDLLHYHTERLISNLSRPGQRHPLIYNPQWWSENLGNILEKHSWWNTTFINCCHSVFNLTKVAHRCWYAPGYFWKYFQNKFLLGNSERRQSYISFSILKMFVLWEISPVQLVKSVFMKVIFKTSVKYFFKIKTSLNILSRRMEHNNRLPDHLIFLYIMTYRRFADAVSFYTLSP